MAFCEPPCDFVSVGPEAADRETVDLPTPAGPHNHKTGIGSDRTSRPCTLRPWES
jgi:hypothetical protein